MLGTYYMIASGIGLVVFYTTAMRAIAILITDMAPDWEMGFQVSTGLPALVLLLSHLYLMARRSSQHPTERSLQYFYIFGAVVLAIGMLVAASGLLDFLMQSPFAIGAKMAAAHGIQLAFSLTLWALFIYRLRREQARRL